MIVDATTIECLECILLESVNYILKAEAYGVECNLEKYIRNRELAYNYLVIGRTDCTLPIAFLTKIKKFTRQNCIDCG